MNSERKRKTWMFSNKYCNSRKLILLYRENMDNRQPQQTERILVNGINRMSSASQKEILPILFKWFNIYFKINSIKMRWHQTFAHFTVHIHSHTPMLLMLHCERTDESNTFATLIQIRTDDTCCNHNLWSLIHIFHFRFYLILRITFI